VPDIRQGSPRSDVRAAPGSGVKPKTSFISMH
jgi:hypothetical protein